jgi:inosine/xanthosine triphosphate pyrophosphatase family protein
MAQGTWDKGHGKLLIATTNKGKLRELMALLSETSIQVVTPDELGIVLDYEETSDDIHLVCSREGNSCVAQVGVAFPRRRHCP